MVSVEKLYIKRRRKCTNALKLDFAELISLINESPGEMVYCSRIRSMFASRACHKATRIGDSLTKKQMKTVCVILF